MLKAILLFATFFFVCCCTIFDGKWRTSALLDVINVWPYLFFKKFGIDFVLNLSTSCPNPDHLQDEHFLRTPVQDSYTEELLPYFEQAFQFLDKVREASGVALIHCLAGISRSPTLAIAYVMRYLHMSQEEAYRYVKEKRPSISPNFNFLGQLLEYEQLLSATRSNQKDSVSVKSSPSNEHAKSLSLSNASRPCLMLRKSNLYPTLIEQSPDSSPKNWQQNLVVSKKSLQSHSKNTFDCSTCSNMKSSSSIVSDEPEMSESVTEIKQCLSSDRWLNGERLETAILCRSSQFSDFGEQLTTPISRSALGLGLDSLSGLQSQAPGMAFRFRDSAGELPSPSTELSKLNFNSQQSPSSPKRFPKIDNTNLNTNLGFNRLSEKSNTTSKENPLFAASRPIPPERRRKRIIGSPVTLMACEETGCLEASRSSDAYSVPRQKRGLKAKSDKLVAVVMHPFLSSNDDLKRNVSCNTYVSNPLFDKAFPSSWQSAPKCRQSTPFCPKERLLKHGTLKIRLSGSTLMRKLIQAPHAAGKAVQIETEQRRLSQSGAARHPKFLDLSKKFQDFLKSSRLHLSGFTGGNRSGYMVASTSEGCLRASSAHQKVESASTAAPNPILSRTSCVTRQSEADYGNSAKTCIKSKFSNGTENSLTSTVASSSSMNSFLTGTSFTSGAKIIEAQNAANRRCSSASLAKHPEIHDCGENMGSSSSLEIVVS